MEQVKKQTVEEFIATTKEWREAFENLYVKNYDRHSRKELKNLESYQYDKKLTIAGFLERQCKDKISFYEFCDIANIVIKQYQELTIYNEMFCKILAVLGVEVVDDEA